MTATDLTIRPALDSDATVLDRLAQLDSQHPLTGDVLLAESGGRAVAALALDDGRATADPFLPSAPALELLRTRAGQLAAGGRYAPSSAAVSSGVTSPVS